MADASSMDHPLLKAYMAHRPPPQLHPVMWVWDVQADRWLLAIRRPASKTQCWTMLDAVGNFVRYEIPSMLTGRCYTHHTPIYAPRSTPE